MTRPTSALMLAFVAFAPPARGEDGQKVVLRTADGVELAGRYRPGPQGPKSPGVLVLDGAGVNRRPTLCDAVAADLGKQGYATLCFDFRGTGGSTAVAEAFWDDPTNRRLVRGYKPTRLPDRIAAKDFRPGYARTLVNDVAAARAFLDRRNDAGECNSGHLMAVGFHEGASVGALWVATEWSRYRVTGGFAARLAPAPEGRDVLGCVWVDPATTLDRRPVPLLDCVKRATAKGTTYVGLLRPKGSALEKLADQCEVAVNRKGHQFRATVLDAAAPDAATSEAVTGMLGRMRAAQDSPPWDDRDFADKRYAWALPGGGTAVAKEEDAQTLRAIPIDRLVGP